MDEKSNNPEEKIIVTKKPAYKRRIILINKPLQFKVAIITLALFFIAAFSVWWEIYSAFSKLSGTGVIDESSANLVLIVSQISKTIFIKIALFLGLVWVLAIALSHYIAGPIFRFEATLKTLQTGDLTQRVRLRKFDQLKNVAEEFNNAIAFLQSTIIEDRDRLNKIRNRLVEIQAKLDQGNAESISGIVSELEKINRSLKTE